LPQYFDPLNPIGFDFDPRQTYEAKYYVNNQLRFNGFAQIIKTKILNEVVNFEIVLFSNVVNFINQFGDIKISELGWTEYNHVLNHTNIANSWDTSVIKNGVATSNFTAGLPDGFGYYYALIDYGFGGQPDEYADNRIFPHLYQREILIKAFEFLGFTIDGSFIDSAMLKKAIIGIGGGDPPKLDSTELNNRLVDLTIDRVITNTYTPAGGTTSLFWEVAQSINLSASATVVQDIKGQYSSPSIQVSNDGNYRVVVNGTIDYDLLISGTGTGSISSFLLGLIVYKNGGIQQVQGQTIINTATVNKLI